MKKPKLQRQALRKMLPKLDIAQEDFGDKIAFLQKILEAKTEGQLKQIVKNSKGLPTIAPIRY